MFKHYQKGDIKDGEDGFAQGTGDIFPAKSDTWTAKRLQKHQPVLLGGRCWMRGPKHQNQSAGYQPEGGQQPRGEPHYPD